MRAPRLRTVLAAATAVVRPAILLLMLLLFAAIAVLIAVLAHGAASAAIDLAVLAGVANFFMTLAIAPSCLLVQRSAWHARMPGLGTVVLSVPLCVALLTIALPTAGVAITGAGDAGFAFAALVCVLVACIAWLMLPMLLMLLLPSLLAWMPREFGTVARLDPGPRTPHMTVWLLALAAVIGCAVALRWRQLVRKPQLSLSFHSSVLEKMGAAPDLMRVSLDNPNVATQHMPAWLMPKMNRRLSATSSARLRTVLGPPFTPGYQSRMILYSLALGAVLVYLTMSQHSYPLGRDRLLVLMGTNLLFGIIGGSGIAFAQRMALIFRPRSGELTELALLPALAAQGTATRSALQAMGIAITQTFATFFAVGVLAFLAGYGSPAIGLAMAWCAVVWLLQLAVCMRHLSVGRRLIDNAGASTLLWMLALTLSLGLLAGLRALWNLWDGPGRILTGPVVAAGLIWLALAVQRWYRHAARLPQPFMIAADRRITPKEIA